MDEVGSCLTTATPKSPDLAISPVSPTLPMPQFWCMSQEGTQFVECPPSSVYCAGVFAYVIASNSHHSPVRQILGLPATITPLQMRMPKLQKSEFSPRSHSQLGNSLDRFQSPNFESVSSLVALTSKKENVLWEPRVGKDAFSLGLQPAGSS